MRGPSGPQPRSAISNHAPAPRGEVVPHAARTRRCRSALRDCCRGGCRGGVDGRSRRPRGSLRRGRPRPPSGPGARARGLPASPAGAAPARGAHGGVAGVGAPRRGGGVPDARHRRPVAPPGGRRRGRPRRAARRALDRYGVRQVARLPAARAHHDPRAPRRAGRARRVDALHQPDQGARPGPARGDRRRSGSASGSPPTTATPPATSATGPASTGSTSSPTPTCSTGPCSRGTTGGAGCSGSLDLVVVDECHHYRGVFGAHVAQVLRRLRRVCAHHGSDPTFVLASATVGNPAEHASRLTGLDVMAVSHDDSPRGEVALALWEPRFTSYAGENGAPVRRAASSESADLLADLVSEGVRTLAFVRSRRAAEQVATTTADAARRGRPVPAGTRRELPRRLPARGAPRDRAGTARGAAAGPGRHQRAGDGHRRLGPRRGDRRRLPRHPRGLVAAGRARRAQRRRRARGPGRPRRPARHLPRHPPGGAARPGGRADRLRPREPLRARSPPVRRRPGGAAARRASSTSSGRARATCSTS